MTSASVVPLARILLEAGANVNYQNRYGEAPLLATMQTNQVASLDLLLDFGASLDVQDADGVSGRSLYLMCGAEVTAAVRKWERRRTGEEAPMQEKACDMCAIKPEGGLTLKFCSRCGTARYCSSECQRECALCNHVL